MRRRLLPGILVACVLHIWLPTSHDAAEKTPLQIDDLYRYDAVTDLVLLPSGKQAVYVREWAERGQLARRQSLWFVAGDSSHRQPVEAEEPDGRRPIMSPDGKWLAFLSTRNLPDGSSAFPPVPVWSEPATDLWLLPIDDGKLGRAVPLAGKSQPYGRVFSDSFYGRVAFSPDSRQIAFVADDGLDPRTPAERELGLTIVREDQGEGYEGYGPAAVWIADLRSAPAETAATRVRRITPNDAWYGDPQWLPDGKSVVVHANRTADRESVRFSINKNYDLWLVELESGRLRQLTTGEGPQVSPRVSPDGKRLVCLSVPRRGPHADIYNLELVELGEQPKSRVLYDHHAGMSGTPPHGLPAFPLPTECWVDKRWLAVDTLQGMRGERQFIDADSPQGQSDSRGPESAAASRERSELRRQLTPVSNEYLQDRLLADDQIIRWKSSDGLEIDGVLTLPPAPVAGRPYKLLLYPHGGPHSRSTPGFNFTVQLFAAEGYAVFQPNFRGTPGYSRKFLDADRYDLGGGDMQDILSGIDHLVREGIVDRERQFVYGISYGGFMTSWLISHTNQFRAAVPQNAVTDMNVMWGVSDLQSWTQWELGGRPWEVPDRMRSSVRLPT